MRLITPASDIQMSSDFPIRSTEAMLPGTRVTFDDGGQATRSAESVREELRARQAHRWVTLDLVAEGGMGTVERVEDRTLGRVAALKRIRGELAEDDQTVRLFVREAQITGQLEHPSIVPVHELADVDGSLRFTMKLVDGRTFTQLIEQFPPGGLTRGTLFDLLEIVVKVCDALAYAHSRGVVHCDIKPDNVMVGDFGQVYVMDWGVARIVGEDLPGGATAPGNSRREPLTDPFALETGSNTIFAGTPSYLPPEQARMELVDARTDVWAVGALLYFMLTRASPYTAPTLPEKVSQARVGTFPSVESYVGSGAVPGALLNIVNRAMAPSADDRFPSAISLRQAIRRFMRGEESLPVQSFAAGQDIVVEGGPGDAAYVIRSGRCEAHRMEHGARVSLRVMGPGELFGETAILSPGPRTASVTALEPLSVHVITADVLQAELRGVQPWLQAIVTSLARRFRERG